MKRVLTLLVVFVVMVTALAIVGHAETSVETLTGNLDSKIITEDIELNLAGYSIGTLTVNPGITVTISGAGSTGVITTVNGGGTVELAEGFMLLGGTNNKLTLGTVGVNLRVDNLKKDGASMYYTSTFGGNQAVLDKIVAYGLALGAGREPNFADNTYTRITKDSEDFSWNTGVATFNDNGVLLKGIMKTSNAYSLNKANSTKKVYNVAYVELTDGTRITSSTKNTTLKNSVTTVTASTNPGSDFWDTLNYTQKTNMVNFYNTFNRVVDAWSLPRLDTYVDNGTYSLYTISDVQMMAANPNASYKLEKYINMNGATLNTIENFTGSINGNGHTISNFKLNGIGFVDTVASGQSITGLYLTNVTMTVPAKSAALNVGLIAGTNNGSITGCAASGTIKDTRTGAADAKINVGALVGSNAGTLTTEPLLKVTYTLPDVTGVEQTYETTGLSADVGLFVEKSDYVNSGLVGTGNAVANAATVYWRDRSYSTERQAASLQAKRQKVVDYVYESGTIKWTVPSTITYYNDQANYPNIEKPGTLWNQIISGKFHIHTQQFTAGKTYIGIPYTHCSSSLEQAKFYMTQNANGVYVLNSEIAKLTGGSNNKAGNADWKTGNIGWAKYLGSDCSSALTVAWHKVSPVLLSSKTNGGVCLFYTTNIVPSEFNQWYYGVRQVGDYVVNDETMSDGKPLTNSTTGANLTYTVDGVTKNRYNVTTDAIVEEIGVDAVYEAYAQTQMGDILNAVGTAGHSRMAAIDPVVIRNGKGVIDPVKSYFVTHEQGDGLYDRTSTNSSWRINYKYTFEQLAYQTDELPSGSNGYYIPVSMDAFHETTVATTGGSSALADGNGVKIVNPASGMINSSFRIQCATVVVKDANGNVKYEKTAYQGTSSSQNRRRAVPGSIPMAMSEFFSDYGKNLTEGQTYTFTVTATNFVGVTTTVVDNASFVYSAS